MAQPFNRGHYLRPPGNPDLSLNEFWVSNAFALPVHHNLSSFERNRLFLNRKGSGFEDVSFLSGADSDGDSRTVIAADFFNRGRLDLLIRQIGGGGIRFYENHMESVGNSLSLQFSRPGARVELTTNSGRQIRDVFSKSASSYSQSPLRCHFGLGGATDCEVLIRWPGGQTTRLNKVKPNQHLHILAPLVRKKID